MLNKNWFAALVLVTACGSDDDNGGHGVDGNKKASSLTADEAKAVCESSEAKAPSLEVVCAAFAATTSQDKAACEMKVKPCVDAASDSCDTYMADLAGCELTLNEVETCENAQVKLIADAIKGVTCDDAGSDDLPDFGMLLEQVPSECKNVAEMCPNFL